MKKQKLSPRPEVTLKLAQSLDGKIATRSGDSKWISSPEARKFVHRLRNEQDAILVGKNTFYQDNPRLNVRLSGKKNNPWKVVFADKKFNLKKKWNLFSARAKVIFIVDIEHLSYFSKLLKKSKCSVVLIPIKKQKGQFVLKDILKGLYDLGIRKLLVEGGGEVAWTFIYEKCVDQIYTIISPKIIGGVNAIHSIAGKGFEKMSQISSLDFVKTQKIGCDLVIQSKVR